MPALVSALNSVDLPTLGKPTIPHWRLMESFELVKRRGPRGSTLHRALPRMSHTWGGRVASQRAAAARGPEAAQECAARGAIVQDSCRTGRSAALFHHKYPETRRL